MATNTNGMATQQFTNPYANVKDPYKDLQNPYLTDAYTKSIKDRYAAQLNEAVASPETSQQAAAMRNKLAGMGVIGGKSYDVGQQQYVNAIKNKYASAQDQELATASQKGLEFGANNQLAENQFLSNAGLQSAQWESQLPMLQQEYAVGGQNLQKGALDIGSQQDILNAAKVGGYDSPFLMDLAAKNPGMYQEYLKNKKSTEFVNGGDSQAIADLKSGKTRLHLGNY